MAITKEKGDIGVSMIMSDILKRGYKVAIPVGEDWRFDLIVYRNEKLERVQCKAVTPSNGVLIVPCRSSNNYSILKYKSTDFEWIGVFDLSDYKCYYIPSNICGNGERSVLNLRLNKPKNGQKKGIVLACDYLNL